MVHVLFFSNVACSASLTLVQHLYPIELWLGGRSTMVHVLFFSNVACSASIAL